MGFNLNWYKNAFPSIIFLLCVYVSPINVSYLCNGIWVSFNTRNFREIVKVTWCLKTVFFNISLCCNAFLIFISNSIKNS